MRSFVGMGALGESGVVRCPRCGWLAAAPGAAQAGLRLRGVLRAHAGRIHHAEPGLAEVISLAAVRRQRQAEAALRLALQREFDRLLGERVEVEGAAFEVVASDWDGEVVEVCPDGAR